MSNVTITGMSIPNTQIPLGPDKTGVCGVTNASPTVTFATALSKVYRGKGGFLIKLHTTIHYVSHVAADGLSLTTTTNYVGSTDASAAYIIYPCLELRFYCDTPFQPVGASYVVQASPIGSPNFFKSVLVSQYDAGTGDLLWMPDIVLPATGNIASPPQQKAKYFPVFYTLQGNQVAFLGGFEKGLRIPETPSSTNWPDLLVAQQTQPYNFLNEASTLSSDQILSLISSAAAIDGTPRTLLMAASGGVAAEDSALSQDVSGNLIAAGSLTLGSDLAVADDVTVGGTVAAADVTASTTVTATGNITSAADLVGAVPTYTIATLPTANVANVRRRALVSDGNRGHRTLRNTTGSTYAWIDDDPVFRPERWGGLADNSTDNTTAVQSAITAIGNNAGRVEIPDGMRFNLKGLTFGQQVALSYRADDDTSTGLYVGQNSGERIRFNATASTGIGGAIVNEWQHTAPFNPGLIIDVRKDVTGHDAFLTGAQSRTNPARASFLFRNERNNVFGIQHIQYPQYDAVSGNYVNGYRKTVTITGITSASFGSVPALLEKITGTTSGATGYILSTSGSNIVLLWISGKFVVGETVSDSNETTVATIATATYAETAFHWLAQSERTGHWSVGLPPDVPTHLFSVGGDIGLTKTRTAGQYVETTIAHPTLHFLDGYEEVSPSGFSLRYDTTNAAGSRVMAWRTYGGAFNLWEITQAGTMSLRHTDGSLMCSVQNNGSGQGLLGVYNAGTITHQFYAGGNSFDNSGAKMGYGFTTAPTARVQIRSTTEQLRLDYDSSNYAALTVGSGGDLVIAPSGGDTGITGTLGVTSASASALAVGANGATNPVVKVNAATASVATGVEVTGAAAGSGVMVAAISSGSNEDLKVGGKGTGVVAGTTHIQNTIGEGALSASFTRADATLTATNLSYAVQAGRSYRIEGYLIVSNSIAAEGAKFDFGGGSCSATAFDLAVTGVNGSNVAGTTASTSLTGAINYTTVTGTNRIKISGYLKVNTGGTLIVRASEDTTAAGTMTLAAGSWIALSDTVLK